MKKIILIVLFSVAIIGCKSKSATSTKLDTKSEIALKGTWEITKVVYPNSEFIKVTSFDVADSKCFIGSTWKFGSNNNKGNIALNSPDCTAFTSPITWYINNEGNFVMKILDESKAKKVKTGYILRIANQTKTSFELIDVINLAGKMTDVVYKFEKLN